MTHFDVFNGDADGLCALQQLRLAEPREARLVTGVKRDIALLRRVEAQPGDSLTVLDISLANNHAPLLALLEIGVQVEYFDHHQPRAPIEHPFLRLVIDTSPSVCTSLLVDRYLGGKHRAWAIVGAFGDNLGSIARQHAQSLGFSGEQTELLKQLGECLNYNGYGDSTEDLLYHPAELHRLMRAYDDPLQFIRREPAFDRLASQWRRDMDKALAVVPLAQATAACVIALPDAPWARRVIGSLAHHLIASRPDCAHAILVPNGRRTLTASLRVPPDSSCTADQFAAKYGGGGRHTAAGIDDLPPARLPDFTADFVRTFDAEGRPT